jgi:hypothetical protein
VPDSGLLVQTPEGVKSVHFNINGVEIEIGSTVMLQASAEQEFTVRTLEGAAVITMNELSYPVIAGTEMSIPVDAQMQAVGLPSMPVPFSEADVGGLPIAPLPREIAPAAPLPEAVTLKLQMLVEEGLEPCGTPGLPVCEHALTPDDNRRWATKDAYRPSEKKDKTSQETDIILTAPDVPVTTAPVTVDVSNPPLISNPPPIATPDTTGVSTDPVVVAPVTDSGPVVIEQGPPANVPEDNKEKEEKEKKEKEEKEKKEKEEKEKKEKEEKEKKK